jgi:hypothetical protein
VPYPGEPPRRGGHLGHAIQAHPVFAHAIALAVYLVRVPGGQSVRRDVVNRRANQAVQLGIGADDCSGLARDKAPEKRTALAVQCVPLFKKDCLPPAQFFGFTAHIPNVLRLREVVAGKPCGVRAGLRTRQELPWCMHDGQGAHVLMTHLMV